jgi:hypothetical protein
MIDVVIMETAMATMITGLHIGSYSYGLKPRLSSMMIGFGIPVLLSYLSLLVFDIADFF